MTREALVLELAQTGAAATDAQIDALRAGLLDSRRPR